MKTNHLFASAAYAAALVVALPAHAQILGGGMHGGVSGMQTATFGGGFGTPRSAVSGQTDLSASARARGRVDGLGRLDRTAQSGTQQAARDAERRFPVRIRIAVPDRGLGDRLNRMQEWSECGSG